MKKPSDETLFCCKYLRDQGYLSEDKLDELAKFLDDFDVDFTLVKVHRDFFTKLAEALRPIWPTGNKDGKYPWRDSVSNLSRRLKILWSLRDMSAYSIDDCVAAANAYVAQFEHDAKYMRTLKYFILKDPPKNSKTARNQPESAFADLLASMKEQEQDIQSVWDALGESMYDNQYELKC